MSLNKPFIPVRLDAVSNDITRFRIRHPAVENVDALLGSVVDQLHAFLLRMALQPLTAKADLTDLQICFS